jgi:enoyl-[acyl-carrier-protein] reductase (NADH)
MLDRVGELGEVASVTVFLRSPVQSIITGNDLLADGGYVGMGRPPRRADPL